MWKHTLMFLVIGASAFVIVSTGETIEPDEESVGEEDCEKQTDESHSETLVNESSEKKSYESHSETQVDECSEKTPKCPANEVYTTCRMATCRPLTCEQLGKPIACPMIIGPCNDGGCICDNDYARHKNGTCIPVLECACGEDPNATSGCGNHCGNSCSDYNTGVKCLKSFCILNGCDCREGFIYDPSVKRCVRPKDCAPTCPSNEFYTKCRIAQCRAQHCFQLGKPIACASIAEPCNDGGCVCNYEYARHDNGTCVPVEQCPCNKKHEKYYECVTDCPPEGCYAAGRKYKCAAPPKPGTPECKPGCKCEPGYWRNNEGACVTEEECKNNQCPINEEFKKCPSDCPGESCDVDPALVLCQKPPQPGDSNCNPDGCRCKWGYCRLNGICVSRDEIKKCKKNEEYHECVNSCPSEKCEHSDRVYKCKPTPKPGDQDCVPGCKCKPNYYRNKRGECVKKNKCDHKKKCPVNEEHQMCPANCPGEDCDVDIRLIFCSPPPKPGDPNCEPDGCRCQNGFCRFKGKCVSREELRNKCKKANEIFTECPKTCPGESCGIDTTLIKCGIPPQPGSPLCAPDACRCKPGFCRNGDGECVEDYPRFPKCPKNEELVKCPSNCPGESCAINPAAVSCARSLEVGDPNCEPDGCRCKWGFCRLNGTCVSRDKVCTKPHEKFVQCPASCPGDSCGVDPRTVRCAEPPQPGDPNCQPDGCVCDPKYCRTTSGQCIYRGY